MNPQISEAPLYDLACASGLTPSVLCLSPITFKSIVGSIMDLLIEQAVPAIVWAKLPRGEVWQAELEQYGRSSHPPEALYWFKNQREALNGSTSGPKAVAPNAVQVLLPPQSCLKREYFLVVWSAQIQVTLLAHRSRSAQPQPSLDSSVRIGDGQDEGQLEGDRKQQLLSLCAFDADLTQQIVAQIATVIAQPNASQINLPGDFEPAIATEIVDRWQQQIAALSPSSTSTSLSKLYAKQLQRQEESWQRSTVHRRRAETSEALQLQNAELLDTVRMKDDFLNTVGQELRTPLTTIKTALKLLGSPNLKPTQRQRYLDMIEQECDRQSSLITRLLELVQLDQMADQRVQSLHLSEVVPGVVSTYQPLAEEKGVRLDYVVPIDLPPIACVNTWLKQIVINLLHNGIKFTPTGGQVWVRAKPHGAHVQLEIRDTGIGIAASEIPKIFDRFYRGRSSQDETLSGTGLGLTIVQQLLIHCGGTISVQSKLGEGSAFQVLLPIYREAAVNEPQL